MSKQKSYKGKTGFWSKYGGRSYSLIDSQNNVVPDIWACQSCGEKQTKEISPLKYEYPEGDWIRVCPLCFAEDCFKLFERIEEIIQRY